MKKQVPLKTRSQIEKSYPNGIDKLEIGSGTHPEPGYSHLDIQNVANLDILADVRKMPLPNNFVTQEIRAVHIMEHFCHPVFSSKNMRQEIGTTVEVLNEIYRVLAPGAKFFMVTPDFDKITRSAADNRISNDWLQRWSVGGHLNMFDVHHWLWTHEDAFKWFSQAGFVDIGDWNPVKNILQVATLNWSDPAKSNNKDWYKVEWYHWLFIQGRKPEKK